jgi:hypothetical protein
MKVRLVGYFEPALAQRVRNASATLEEDALCLETNSLHRPRFP